MQTLKNNINYDNPEIYRGPIKAEIINRSHGNGYLHLKVFKILNPKNKGTSGDSDSDRGAGGQLGQYGNKNVRALLDDVNRKFDELTAEELQKRILQLKTALDCVKRGARHPS